MNVAYEKQTQYHKILQFIEFCQLGFSSYNIYEAA